MIDSRLYGIIKKVSRPNLGIAARINPKAKKTKKGKRRR